MRYNFRLIVISRGSFLSAGAKSTNLCRDLLIIIQNNLFCSIKKSSTSFKFFHKIFFVEEDLGG